MHGGRKRRILIKKALLPTADSRIAIPCPSDRSARLNARLNNLAGQATPAGLRLVSTKTIRQLLFRYGQQGQHPSVGGGGQALHHPEINH